MMNNVWKHWHQASRLVHFFTDFPAWLCKQSGFSGVPVALQQEYQDLFWGTNAAVYIPLWASVCKYEHGCLMDETTLSILRRYHANGYAPIEMDGNPPDYIGQQLRYLCYLYASALYAEAHGESSETILREAEDFISLYLLDTVRVIAHGIQQYSSTPLFLELADRLIAVCTDSAAFSHELPDRSMANLVCYETYLQGPAMPIASGEAAEILTAGRNNCGGKCSIRATVQDGCLLHLESGCDIGEPTFRACVRGRGYRTTYLTGQRLRYPMKRIGKRGEGRFQRISWEEAADLVASELKRVKNTYGPGARYINYGDGNSGLIRPDDMMKRLLNLDGGYLGNFGSYSAACTRYVTPYIYGNNDSGNSNEDILNTRLLLLWGHNPTETIFSPQLTYLITQAKECGAKVIVIDPRQSDSAVALADEWIPIRPSTDGALVDAMAYVIFSEGLQDQTFMDRYCIGFDEAHMPEGAPKEQNYRNYLFGGLDGVEKTPEWAEVITGLPAERIRSLARAYATTKPACLLPGLGNQRIGNGEQTVRGMIALTCMTGNVGIPGGGAAGSGSGREEAQPVYPTGTAAYPGQISCFQWVDAIEHGTQMTRAKDHIRGVEQLDSNIKMLFNLASNTLINQHAEINHTIDVLQDESQCEFIVGTDVFMTPSARFVDLLLPAPSFLEEDNISMPWRMGHYLLSNRQLIRPLFGCRTEFDWMADVAKKLGIYEAWSDGHNSPAAWMEFLYNDLRKINTDLPAYDKFRVKGGHTYRDPKVYIAYAEQIRDPEHHPFETPSGKIEIYSQRLAEFDDPQFIPALPIYTPCSEGYEDPLREKYPLQLIGWHTKRRCHTIHDNNPWLEEVEPQQMWMHPTDAQMRGLSTGDIAEVYNDRGRLRIPVLVTERIIPGVAAIPQGAWYTPNRDGIDTRGSINVLTANAPTPLAKGNPQHTNLVEVRRFS